MSPLCSRQRVSKLGKGPCIRSGNARPDLEYRFDTCQAFSTRNARGKVSGCCSPSSKFEETRRLTSVLLSPVKAAILARWGRPDERLRAFVRLDFTKEAL